MIDIRSMPSVYTIGLKWIRVEDEIPPVHQEVLVWNSKLMQCEVRYRLNEVYENEENCNKYVWNEQGIFNEISYWMFLPNAPEEK
jgi:hypothetical protein